MKGGGGRTKTRPAHGAEFLQDEKTAGACGPLGRGGRREVRRAHAADPAGLGVPHPAPHLWAPTGTAAEGAREQARIHLRFSAGIPPVPCCWH